LTCERRDRGPGSRSPRGGIDSACSYSRGSRWGSIVHMHPPQDEQSCALPGTWVHTGLRAHGPRDHGTRHGTIDLGVWTMDLEVCTSGLEVWIMGLGYLDHGFGLQCVQMENLTVLDWTGLDWTGFKSVQMVWTMDCPGLEWTQFCPAATAAAGGGQGAQDLPGSAPAKLPRNHGFGGSGPWILASGSWDPWFHGLTGPRAHGLSLTGFTGFTGPRDISHGLTGSQAPIRTHVPGLHRHRRMGGAAYRGERVLTTSEPRCIDLPSCTVWCVQYSVV